MLVVLGIILSAAHGPTPQPVVAGQHVWGPSADGLRIGLAVLSGTDPGLSPQFEVSLQNTGKDDFVLNVGYMLANGRVMFPAAVRLELSDFAGHTRELEYFDRRYPGIAGRVDDFTVALRAGSTYALRLSLDNYWSPGTKDVAKELPPGRYRIRARFAGKRVTITNLDMQGVGLLNFWKGVVQSGIVELEIRER